MKKVIIFLIVITTSALTHTSFAKDSDTEGPKTTIKSSDIIEFIKSERPLVKKKHLIDVIEKFRPIDFVLNERFGNRVQVLNLKDISLSGENLEWTNFRMANMVRSDLRDSNIIHSDFVGVDFSGADLRGANFYQTNLSKAKFVGANLNGTNFNGANLFKANFDKVTGISDEERKKLKYLTTKYRKLDREELKGMYDE